MINPVERGHQAVERKGSPVVAPVRTGQVLRGQNERLQHDLVCRISRQAADSGEFDLGSTRHLCAAVIRGAVLISEGPTWQLVAEGEGFIARGWPRVLWKCGARGAELVVVTLDREHSPPLWLSDSVELKVLGTAPATVPTDGPTALAFFAECLIRARSKPPEGMESNLHRVLATLRAQPAGDWRIEPAARLAGYSPSQFARLWRREFGRPFSESVVWERVKKACEILAKSTLDVAQVAVYAGFPDARTLRSALREHTAFKPADLRAPSSVDGEPIARRRP